jgi:hypothetical protein
MLHRPHSTGKRNVAHNAGFEAWLVQNNVQLPPGLKPPLHTITAFAEERRKMYEDTLGPKEGSKQEAVHPIVRLQDGKSQRSAEYMARLKKVARKIERGREWQRWYDEVYGERLWEVGDRMPDRGVCGCVVR